MDNLLAIADVHRDLAVNWARCGLSWIWAHRPMWRGSHWDLVWPGFPQEITKPAVCVKLVSWKRWQQIKNFTNTVWTKQSTSSSQTTSRDLKLVSSWEDELAPRGRWPFWALAYTLKQPCAVGRDCEHHSVLGRSSGPCQHYLCVQSSDLPKCPVQRKLLGDKNVFMEVDSFQVGQHRARSVSFVALLFRSSWQHRDSEKRRLLLFNLELEPWLSSLLRPQYPPLVK